MRFGLSLQIVKSMGNEIKKKAKSFLKEYGLQNVTLESLRSAIQKQGYTIIEYNNIFNDENVAALIDALGLEYFCERSKGFTYADTKRRLVFLHEDLSDKEKLMILAHEEGHIYCNHLTSTPVLGRDVIEEHVANEFAHYLLHQSAWRKIEYMVKERKKAVAAVVVAIALLVVSGFIGYKIYCGNTYYGEYYITSTGNKYHDKDCGYVKGKDNVERLTREQYESGEYEPCGKCLAN